MVNHYYMSEPFTRKGKEYPASRQKRTSYHATLRQACKYAIDHMASECDCVEKLIRLLDEAEEIMVSKCEEK
jgi:hypothetical protein